MQSDYMHMVVLLDRTGSMESIRDDTIGGFNAFLEDQQKLPGLATMTFVQFDGQDPYEVLSRFTPIALIPKLSRQSFIPRANTPLLDAMGRAMVDLETSLGAMAAEQKPAKVVMVVITDGKENASREFRKPDIAKMIAHHQTRDGWQFVYLSADFDAMDDAQAYGIKAGSAMHFSKTQHGTREAFSSVSSKIADYRSDRSDQVVFDEDDRQKQNGEGDTPPTGKTPPTSPDKPSSRRST